MNDRAGRDGDDDADLWDNEDEFYYDLLRLPGRRARRTSACARWSG